MDQFPQAGACKMCYIDKYTGQKVTKSEKIMSNSSEEKKEQQANNDTVTPDPGPESSQESVDDSSQKPEPGQTGQLPDLPDLPDSASPATKPPAEESTVPKTLPRPAEGSVAPKPAPAPVVPDAAKDAEKAPVVEGSTTKPAGKVDTESDTQETEQQPESDRVTQTQEATDQSASRKLKRRATRQQLSKPDTAVLASTRLRRSSKGSISQGTVSFGEQRELILVIRGIVERIVLPEDQSIVLGRSDARLRYHADVDLTPYGALDRGVSREHARVYTEGGHLYIVDMNSTNGTFLAGKRLDANAPTLLRKGDELLLGRLPVQILFR